MINEKSADQPNGKRSGQTVVSQANVARYAVRVGKLVALLLLVVAVVFASYQFGVRRGVSASGSAESGGATSWTCSMHPQIQLPKPGQCPICFMDLIPLEADDEDSGPRELKMTRAAAALAGVRTVPVVRRYVTKEIRLVGKVDYDETRLSDITAWVPGRLDRLFVDYTGVPVKRGDHLVYLYSPDLVVAQQELLQAERAASRAIGSSAEMAQSTLKSVEDKLMLLGLLPEQIAEIKQRGTPSDHMTIYAPVGGVVVHMNATEGMYVKTGTHIYTIADLSTVWVYLDAYESDLPWLRYGQRVEFHSESYPGEIFRGEIVFIDPVLDETTRTVKVRLNVDNSEGKLKPGMFVRAEAKSRVARGGQVLDSTMAGKWISPMHPEIIKDGPGQCDICGMDLVPVEEYFPTLTTSSIEAMAPLVIPVSAPLITGKRAVVYVQIGTPEAPKFEGRDVLLGTRAGDQYIVRHGLKEGELVVVAGNFRIDADLQIKGRASMMNPQGGAASGGHQHGGSQTRTTATEHVEDVSPAAAASLEVPRSFRSELRPLYSAYLDTVEALAADDLAAVRAGLERVLTATETVDSSDLESVAQARWTDLENRLMFAAYETLDATDRPKLREQFVTLSNLLVSAARMFGHDQLVMLYEFKSSAGAEARARWLQRSELPLGPFGEAESQLTASYAPRGPLAVPPRFRSALMDVYRGYLELQLALAQEGHPQAAMAAAKLATAVQALRADGLSDSARGQWDQSQGRIAEVLTGDWKELDHKEQRSRFEKLSLAILEVVDSFGHDGSSPLYKAFCPMAFDNRGAVWLQASEQIHNPYFSGKMLRCGEVRRVIAAVDQEGAR